MCKAANFCFPIFGQDKCDTGQADKHLQACSIFSPAHILAQCSFSVLAKWLVLFAQQDLICHSCGKDHLRDSKMLLHTAFRIGQRDLWIAGYSPGLSGTDDIL